MHKTATQIKIFPLEDQCILYLKSDVFINKYSLSKTTLLDMSE